MIGYKHTNVSKDGVFAIHSKNGVFVLKPGESIILKDENKEWIGFINVETVEEKKIKKLKEDNQK